MGLSPAAKSGILFGSLLISALASKKKGGLKDVGDEPFTQSSRGSRIPRMFGPREVAPILSWRGNRTTKQAKTTPAGKGLATAGGGDTSVFYEEGLHVLTLGPGRRMLRITQASEPIMEDPITPETHPDGSLITLDNNEGSFRIYWGYESGGLDNDLSDPERLGILSRWPYALRVFWVNKRLGQTAVWPDIRYELEVAPSGLSAGLDANDSWMEDELEAANQVIDGVSVPFPVSQVIQVSTEYKRIILRDHVKERFEQSGQIQLNNSPNPIDSEPSFTIASIVETVASEVEGLPVEYEEGDSAPGIGEVNSIDGAPCSQLNENSWPKDFKMTVIETVESISESHQADTSISCVGVSEPEKSLSVGSFQFPEMSALGFKEKRNGGANLAHVLADLFFLPAPLGLNRPTSKYDLNSFAAMSQKMLDERYKGSVLMETGQTVSVTVEQILKDTGYFLIQNSASGLMELVPLRIDELEQFPIDNASLQGDLPEKTSNISASTRPSATNFSFLDRSRSYERTPIFIDEDGLAELGAVDAASVIQIDSTVDPESATQEAVRRENEGLGSYQLEKITAGFDSRDRRPGDVVIRDGRRSLVVKSQLKLEDDEPGAELDLADASLVVSPSAYLPLPAGTSALPKLELKIDHVRLWQIPAMLKTTSADVEIACLWIRDTPAAAQAVVYLSTNGLSYSALGVEPVYVTGGLLDNAFSSAGISVDDIQENGPVIRIQGPDIDLVKDLLGNNEAFEAGQQIVVIGDDVWFLKGVQALTPELYRLKGVKYGQFGTSINDHPLGTPVYIVETSSWKTMVNAALLQFGQSVEVKVQALGSGTPQNLSQIDPFTFNPTVMLQASAKEEMGASYQYDANGKVERIDFENGGYKIFTYDTNGRVSVMETHRGTFDYAYNPDGSLLSVNRQ